MSWDYATLVPRKLILQTRMCSHAVGLDVWFFVRPFVNFHTSCVRTAKALVAYVINTTISWAGSNENNHLKYLSCLMTKSTKWLYAQQRLRESSLCTQWVAKDPSFLQADSEDSDQTGRMPRLICVFAGHTATLLVLPWGGSFKRQVNKDAWLNTFEKGVKQLYHRLKHIYEIF